MTTIPYGRDFTDDNGEPLAQPVAAIDMPPDPDPVMEQHRGQLRMAERLVKRHAGHLRHAHGLGWYVWDGRRWAPDKDGASLRAAVDTVKAALRQLAALAGEDREKLYRDVRRAETASGLDGMLRIAGSLRPVAVPADALDADPYLFNTATGTLDLRTGETRAHDPADLITKVAGCGLDDDADASLFETFLAEVLPDAAVREFVQRLMGYAMLGKVNEHVLGIFTGTGQNGKSTLVNLAKLAFGDYAIAADPDMLIDKGSSHPTGQADLLGVRLAVASETDEGRALAAATVKRLTGGDPIRARKMRKDFFEFLPSHTLIMVTNFKPKVSGDDAAMWRRIRVVPFDVVVERPDPALPDRLALALPAVLRWVYEGYRAYVEQGLAAPEAVQLRTKEYQTSSDALGRFFDDRLIATSNTVKLKARELYNAWTSWCHGNGEQPGSEVALAEAMGRRGYEKRKSDGVMKYLGLMLTADDEEPAHSRWND